MEFHAKDLGSLIWTLVVVIGVVSSIIRSARKRIAAQPKVPAQPAQAPVRRGVQLLKQDDVVAPAIVPRAPTPVATPAVPAPPPAPVQPSSGRSPAFRGMFVGRGKALVSAIIAAEVLGPPKALQEQTLWSPRHSDPSI
jgi:hypothetical protein